MKKHLDPYATLGVAKDADKATIKKAHRKKVAKAHPDKGGNAEEFHAVQRSYEILSDDKSRERFDKTGDTSEPVSLRERCMTELARLAIICVSEIRDHRSVDLVKIMRDSTQQMIDRTTKEREGNQLQAAKFKDAALRFKAKKGVENPFVVMLTQQAQQFANGVRVCDEKIEMGIMCQAMLADFKYDWNKPDKMTAMCGAVGFKPKVSKQ